MSLNIWDAESQELQKVAGQVNISDSIVSDSSTWSSEKINVNLGELSDSLADKVDKTNLANYVGKSNGGMSGTTYGGDLNDLTEVGMYSVATKINTPPTGDTLYGTLTVTKGMYDSFIAQTVVATSNRVFARQKDGSTWSDWQELATMDKFTDNSFITPTYDSTLIDSVTGGYKIIGKMVIVNMQFIYKGAPNARVDVADLPLSAYNGAGLVVGDWDMDTRTTEYALSFQGKLRLRLPTAEGRRYCVTGVYMME